jgi:hypothetical protein
LKIKQLAIHRRDAEDAELTQRLESRSTLCAPSALSASLR